MICDLSILQSLYNLTTVLDQYKGRRNVQGFGDQFLGDTPNFNPGNAGHIRPTTTAFPCAIQLDQWIL